MEEKSEENVNFFARYDSFAEKTTTHGFGIIHSSLGM